MPVGFKELQGEMGRFLKFLTTLLVFAFCAAPFAVDYLNPAALLPKKLTLSTLDSPLDFVLDSGHARVFNQLFLTLFILYSALVWAYLVELYVGKKRGAVFHTLSITAVLFPFLIAAFTVLFGKSESLFQPIALTSFFLLFFTNCFFFYLLFTAFFSVYKRIIHAVLFTVLFPVGIVVTQAYILIKGAERIRVSGPVS